MKIENLTRLRELASAARIEWRVADPATKAFCMRFDHSDSTDPEGEARAWLENHRKQHPGGRFVDYEVVKVEVRSELQKLTGELLEALNGEATSPAQAEAIRIADEQETVLLEVANGERRPGKLPIEPFVLGAALLRTLAADITHLHQYAEQLGRELTKVTPNLENLQDRLLAPTPIERDDIGHWYHPHLPDCDEGVSYGDLLAVFGMEVACVAMESDAPEEVAERYFDQGVPDCSAWQPTPPEGEGWALLAIYETEDGPYALFARKAPEPRPPSLRTATERARKFESAYYKEARRAIEFGDVIQNYTHAMQAAVIEANLGDGPAEAMAWIINTLRGPGHLPDLDAAAKLPDPKGAGLAQVWFDLMEAQHAAFREAHPAPQPPKGGA